MRNVNYFQFFPRNSRCCIRFGRGDDERLGRVILSIWGESDQMRRGRSYTPNMRSGGLGARQARIR